jgi:hypothetical protein
MSLATLDVPRKTTGLSTTKLPTLRLPRFGRLLGRIIAAYASAISECFGAAMGLRHDEHNARTKAGDDY